MMTLNKNLTRTELARALGCSRVTLWNYEQRGLLPKPERVSSRRSEFPPSAQMLAYDLLEGARA